MADASDSAVFGFFDLLGLVLALPLGDTLYRGEHIDLRQAIFAGLGFGSAVFGHTWPRLRPRLNQTLAVSVPQIASDARWWLILLLTGFAFSAPSLAHPLVVISAIALAVVVSILALSRTGSRSSNPVAITDEQQISKLADEDAEIMDQRVYWIRHIEMLPDPKLGGTAPFVEFHQQMINASVLPIILESEIEGRLRIDGEEQKDKLEFSQSPRCQKLEVPRGMYRDFVIRQWLTTDVARQMADRLQTVFEFSNVNIHFSFEHRGEKRTVVKGLGNQVPWERLPKQQHPVVRLRMWSLDPRIPDSDTTIGYKAKLTFVFTNESGRSIDIVETQFHGVPVQQPFGYGYRIETVLDGWKHSQWGKEDNKISVQPGWSFKLWIGLDSSIPHPELEKRRNEVSLGGLLIGVKIGNQPVVLQYQV